MFFTKKELKRIENVDVPKSFVKTKKARSAMEKGAEEGLN